MINLDWANRLCYPFAEGRIDQAGGCKAEKGECFLSVVWYVAPSFVISVLQDFFLECFLLVLRLKQIQGNCVYYMILFSVQLVDFSCLRVHVLHFGIYNMFIVCSLFLHYVGVIWKEVSPSFEFRWVAWILFLGPKITSFHIFNKY